MIPDYPCSTCGGTAGGLLRFGSAFQLHINNLYAIGVAEQNSAQMGI